MGNNELSKTDIGYLNNFAKSLDDKEKYPIRVLQHMKKQAIESGSILQIKRAEIIDLEIAKRSAPAKIERPIETASRKEVELRDETLARRYIEKIECARRKGIPFDLSLAQMKRLLNRKRCHYSGIEFDLSVPAFRPSFDRIDSSKGYTIDNVVVCMTCINELKNHLLEVDGAIFKGRTDLLVKVSEAFHKTISSKKDDKL